MGWAATELKRNLREIHTLPKELRPPYGAQMDSLELDDLYWLTQYYRERLKEYEEEIARRPEK